MMPPGAAWPSRTRPGPRLAWMVWKKKLSPARNRRASPPRMFRSIFPVSSRDADMAIMASDSALMDYPYWRSQ